MERSEVGLPQRGQVGVKRTEEGKVGEGGDQRETEASAGVNVEKVGQAAREGQVDLVPIIKKLRQEHDLAKAVKADNADVPVHIWD
jgi:hypothetical protein